MKRRKALIVDDEYAARETLCRLADWERFGFDPPMTAVNGLDALELYKTERFDLVFTDIEMPVMNGIDLITQIKKLDPSQRVVVISCHEKFEYAHRALRLGVDDYIIKDLITENELTAFLSSYSMSGVTDSSPPKREQDTLYALLRSTVRGEKSDAADLGGDDTAVWGEKGRGDFGSVALFHVVIDDYGEMEIKHGADALPGMIAGFLNSLDCPAYYYDGADAALIAYGIEDNSSTLYFYNNVMTISNTIRSGARKHGFQSVSIGVSDLLRDARSIGGAFVQSVEASQMRVLLGPNKTIVYNTIALRKGALDFRQMDYLLKCIDDFCGSGNTACLKLIDKLYNIELPNSFADINYYRYVNSRLWVIVVGAARLHGREYTRILDHIGMDIDNIDRMENSAAMADFFKSFLISLFTADGEMQNDNIVNRALRLIEREYMGDISLNYIAGKLHTNKSYLSRSFKEQTGENIMSHITKKKIWRAEYLLHNTQMKLYEISDSLSFTSPQYFSTVFKRYTGRSPNEYKKNAYPNGQPPIYI